MSPTSTYSAIQIIILNLFNQFQAMECIYSFNRFDLSLLNMKISEDAGNMPLKVHCLLKKKKRKVHHRKIASHMQYILKIDLIFLIILNTI